jgi:hypothetical protein
MRSYSQGAVIAGLSLCSLTAAADVKEAAVPPGLMPTALASVSDVVVLGKVIEIEKDTVEAAPVRGQPKDLKWTYKIAVVKIEDPIIGARGLTQLRVGFPAEGGAPGVVAVPPGAPPGGAVARPIRAPQVTLKDGMEACFFLSRHDAADFYIAGMNGVAQPILKNDDKFAGKLEEVRKVAKVLDEPVVALKAKELDDRFHAAHVILQRNSYSDTRRIVNRVGALPAREPIPAEENKLILALMAELPWQPDQSKPRPATDPVAPSRSALWNLIYRADLVGFKQPSTARKAGDPPVNITKIMDEATAAYLKDNKDKIKIKRFAEK